MIKLEQLILTVILLASTICAAGAVAYLAFLGYRPDRGTYPLRGIDVSHHQGAIDWAVVRSSGVDFVYMKATEGGDFKDRRFAINWPAAGLEGLLRGAYHFFTLCRSGEAQAMNFIASVPVAAGSLPPAVDLEFGGNCARRPSEAELSRELGVFLDLVERHYGQAPILYSTRGFYDRYLARRFCRYGLWLRSLILEPAYAERPWIFWQFHNRARVAGIDGPVDLNLYRHGLDAPKSLLVASGREQERP